ncbi:MAG: hypothetical protein ACR2MP_12150 [Streptosporangiaceae bacterium]
MDRYSSSLPDDHANYLADIVKALGSRWEVGQEADTGVWFAVERPTPTSLHIVVDHTLTGLAAKLNAEGSAS